MREYYNKNDLGLSFGFVTVVYVGFSFIVALIIQLFGNVASWVNAVLLAVCSLALGASAFVYAKISKTDFVTATKIKEKPHLAHVGWGCIATLFLITMMIPLNNWIMNLIEMTGLKRPSVDLDMDVASMIIVACVIPAFTEELAFRGTIVQSLAREKNKLASLAITGALFAVFHMNPAQTLHQFVLGAFMALLAYRSGSLWTSVIVHLLNNTTAVVLSFTVPDSFFIDNALWMFFVGLIGFAGCVVGYMFTTKSKWQTQDEDVVVNSFSKTSLGVAVGICAFMWIAALLV